MGLFTNNINPEPPKDRSWNNVVYEILLDVNYYSPEFCGGLFSTTFDFKFKHPDCV